MVVVTFIVAFVIAFGAAFFVVQNPTLVAANFFGYTIQSSLAVFVLIGLGVGFLTGILVMLPGRIKAGIANSRSRKRLAELEGSGSRRSNTTSRQPAADEAE